MSRLSDFHKVFGFSPPISKESFLTGKLSLDIIKMDEILGQYIREYDPKECTYKGDQVSMSEFIERHYGPKAVKLVNEILTEGLKE